MEKVGIVFGCFIPLHDGHKHLIEEALRENDKVIIAVCGYDSDRGKDFIPFSDRFKLMYFKYIAFDNVYVTSVNDHAIGLTGKFDTHSWKLWIETLLGTIPSDFYDTAEITWYTGELSYIEKMSEIRTRDNFKYYGRQSIPVSGTMIREHYSELKKYVDKDFREYLDKHGIF